MSEGDQVGSTATERTPETISIVQRGNLKKLETTLRKQWRLEQNIVLCWSLTDNGLLVLLVPHYFLGNYSATQSSDSAGQKNKEEFIRKLISGRRLKERDEFFEIANGIGISPTYIKLDSVLSEESAVIESVEQTMKRYGISYVENRAVFLFDISDFSLFTPFEQASQLNSLAYSLNSAYNKLLAKGIEVNFARTTTGDGFYVWNRETGSNSDLQLFQFMLLAIADNATARKASKGNTVPDIRTAFHSGSHYELYQAEGVNPTLFSYIVGDVTIELARLVDMAQPGQLFVGDFGVSKGLLSSSAEFIEQADLSLDQLLGIQLSGEEILKMQCLLSTRSDDSDQQVRRYQITDKHGLSRYAYNLVINIETSGQQQLTLGLDNFLSEADENSTKEERLGTVDGQAVGRLGKESKKSIVEK